MIRVECPHCETRFQLQPGMVGKTIRCPNQSCQEFFLVSAPDQPSADSPSTKINQGITPERDSASAPYTIAAESAGEAVFYERIESDPVLPTSAVGTPGSMSLLPERMDSPQASTSAFFPPAGEEPTRLQISSHGTIPESGKSSEIAGASSLLPHRQSVSGPREIVWSGEAPPVADVTASVGQKAIRASSELSLEEEFFLPQRRKTPWGRRIVVGLGLSLIAVLVGLGVMVTIYQAQTEERLAAEALSSYKAGNFELATKQFKQLCDQYHQSVRYSEYQFFAGLASIRAAVESPSARQSPWPALKQLTEFVAEFAHSPWAQPGAGYGSDLVQAGQKLCLVLGNYASDQLLAAEGYARQLPATWPEYQTEQQRESQMSSAISAATEALKSGEQLITELDRFREKDGLNFEEPQKRFAELRQRISVQTSRAAAIQPWRDLPSDPTDLRIEQFEKAMRVANLLGDPEVQRLSRWAEEELRKRITGSVTFRRAEQQVEPDLLTGLFTSAVVEQPRADRSRASGSPPVFAVVRGILYALEAQTGERLWAVRVADSATNPRAIDVPVLVTLADGQTTWAIVVSQKEGQAELTARDARTGKVQWQQPLEAEVAGRPLILQRRAYVPLADPLGTVVEIQLTSGDRVGQFQIRQKIGAALAGGPGPSAGTSRLYVPADARHVFVLEVGAEDADGRSLPPRLVRDLRTEHPRDSLTGTTLLIGQTGDNQPRYLLLTVADGPAAMIARCYDLTQGDPPPVAEVAIPGWSRFPAATNGEQVVVATDAGGYAVLGVNQEGSHDRSIFLISAAEGQLPQQEVAPALVVDASSEQIWVVVQQQLLAIRPAVDPVRGLRYLKSGKPIWVGEPVHQAQQSLADHLNVVVTRLPESRAFRATAFDRQTGEIRWQQQLGVIPEQWVATPTGLVLVADATGACYEATRGLPLIRPLSNPRGVSILVGEGGRFWSLVPSSAEDPLLYQLRELMLGSARPDLYAGSAALAGIMGAVAGCGSLVSDRVISLPAPLAGAPAVLGRQLLLPGGDGQVYRLSCSGPTWERGPRWSEDLPEPDRRGFLTPVSDSRVLIADGRRRVALWDWPRESSVPNSPHMVWETRYPIVQPPLILQQEPLKFMTADDTGSVTLFSLETPGEPLRRWQPRFDQAATPGKIRQPLQKFSIGTDEAILVVHDQRVMTCLSTDQLTTRWTAPEIPLPAGLEWVGVTIAGNRLYAVDQTGRVTVFRGEDGRVEAIIPAPRTGALAAKPVVIPRAGVAYLPLLDGTWQELRLPSTD
jgi:hypothetical protein